LLDNRFIIKTLYHSKDIGKIFNALRLSIKENLLFLFSKHSSYVEYFWHRHKTPSHIFNSNLNIAESKITDIYNFEISTENIRYLYRIKAICDLYNVELIFIRSPLPQHIHYKNEFIFNHIRETFFSDIKFLDFKNFPLPLKDFADNQHLNIYGRRKFSNFFYNNICKKKLLNIESVKDFITIEIRKYERTTMHINHTAERCKL